MEEDPASTILDGDIIGIRFGLASSSEICKASISNSGISHASQLSNPFLGLPLEFGKCESCGTSEPGKCEGHFGYIELPIPIYHPSHISELRRMLSLLCLKCLKMKRIKFQMKNRGISERLLPQCCEDSPPISIREVKTTDGACYLELKLPSRSKLKNNSWNFLERYGFRYGDSHSRPLLPYEVKEIIKKIPLETRKKLSGKGYFPQDGYILQYLPVPPNCLSVPDISDGVSVMSSDLSISVLKKVLKQVEIIKSSRSGTPNFESHEVEANDLQSAVDQYLKVRGTSKSSRDVESRFGIYKETNENTTKAWLEKMRTLFIRKGSGFSSRSVITGDAYKAVNEIGIPFEIAQRITFEEKVSVHNMSYLQDLMDKNLCLTYRDGSSTYSLREGSKGHTFLRPGQVVHRRIMDGDIVFINRPPTTHKHSLQALSAYVHDDHTVKINPLICGPLSADFDGDCVHLFYPQSLAAKAEVLELFSVDKQLLSSHTGNLNLQLAADSLLSLKMMFKTYFMDRAAAQQLAMFVTYSLPQPAVLKAHHSGPYWTALQMLQTALPACFDCCGDSYLISKSSILKFDVNRDIMQSVVNEIVTSIFFEKGPHEVLKFFNFLQPLLMENLFAEGFSVGLEDFSISWDAIQNIQKNIQVISPLLHHVRSTYNELVELQLENHIRLVKQPAVNFILESSAMGNLIDAKSDSAINKVVQQIGFLGLQLSDKGKFYSKNLVEEMASLFQRKYPSEGDDYPSAEHGFVKSCFFHGLDPYEEMVHSISSREVIVRSSRGLSEPGTLFKNLMAILRDVVICYDGTVRNISSNSIIQFEYGIKVGAKTHNLFPAGEPVGVLAATAMSNPAYKAVLDSTPSSNSSWELMKEILLSKVSFKNDRIDRRVILYLNDCGCGRKYCRENAACLVNNLLKKVSLKDTAVEFLIEYKRQRSGSESLETDAGLVGHVHLNKMMLEELSISMHEVLQKCQETINLFRKKKKETINLFKRTVLSVSECCSFKHSCADKFPDMPCLMFFCQDTSDIHLERTSHILSDTICPVLLETIIKGNPLIHSANITWISPDTTTWIRNPSQSQKGELALDIVLEKSAVKQSGDAWRIVLNSCLPVLHLIDTTRSIPYGIKQVQELLGISCAFDQTVQRLSTSVTMVTRGVLKEHLILLSNSMTSSGNLIGFNSGGYKTLSRSWNLQIPFTEATLFTPRRCFERASEKCHTDSLSSIVASCSWGKHVAVGTGSRFDVLWDTKEVGLDQEDRVDVYSFLHMVGSSNREEPNTACLGTEIDDLVLEDEDAGCNLSPEHDFGFGKPTFEDSEDVPSESAEEGKWGGEKLKNAEASTAKPNAWTSWGREKAETQDVPSSKAHGDWGFENVQSTRASTAMPDKWSGSWSEKADTEDVPCSSGWGSDKVETLDVPSTKVRVGWGGDNLGNVGTSTSKPNAWSSWGRDKAETQEVPSTEGQEYSSRSRGWDEGDNWKGSKQLEPMATWGKTAEDVDESGSHKSDGKSSDQGREALNWDNKVSQEKAIQSTSSWVSSGTADWNKDNHPTQAANHVESPANNHSWGHQKNSPEISHGWGSPYESNQQTSMGGWDSPNVGVGNESEKQDQWGQQNKKSRFESSRGWGSNAGDWKNKRKPPAKTPGMVNDESGASGIFTATRQRIDMFTSEEQEILLDVEPIMQSIRRIMHQSGYTDGNPLSAEDQSYILDNVFNFHPDKAVKMGAGIDHIMVSRHSNFVESRCFYVVSTDGRKEDFSYHKCLDNFIKEKYPDMAESFIAKYFRKPRSGGNREKSLAPEEIGGENRQ